MLFTLKLHTTLLSHTRITLDLAHTHTRISSAETIVFNSMRFCLNSLLLHQASVKRMFLNTPLYTLWSFISCTAFVKILIRMVAPCSLRMKCILIFHHNFLTLLAAARFHLNRSLGRHPLNIEKYDLIIFNICLSWWLIRIEKISRE